MSIKRFGVISAGIAATALFSIPASAQSANGQVTSFDQCAAVKGDILPLQDVKHCLVAIYAADEQPTQENGNLEGVVNCDNGTVIKAEYGDVCMINLEPGKKKSAPKVIEKITIIETPEEDLGVIEEGVEYKGTVVEDAVEMAEDESDM